MALVESSLKLKSRTRLTPGSREQEKGLSRIHKESEFMPDGIETFPAMLRMFTPAVHASVGQRDSVARLQGNRDFREPSIPLAWTLTSETDQGVICRSLMKIVYIKLSK